MVKDTLDSIFDNLKERTTNPFLGTLLVVWVVKNWKLVYSLLYFDGNFKLKDRLDYITHYFSERSFIWNMVSVISLTIVVLVFTYALLSMSRLLTDFYDRVVIPWISKLTDKGSVVLKIEYVKLLDEVTRMNVRLEEERLARISAQNERDNAYAKLLKSNEASDIDMEGLDNSTDGTIKTSQANNIDRAKFRRIINFINGQSNTEEFNGIIDKILNDDAIYKNELIIKLLLREEIALLREDLQTGKGKYTLTDEGRTFLRYWNESMTGPI